MMDPSEEEIVSIDSNDLIFSNLKESNLASKSRNQTIKFFNLTNQNSLIQDLKLFF